MKETQRPTHSTDQPRKALNIPTRKLAAVEDSHRDDNAQPSVKFTTWGVVVYGTA